LYLVGRQTETTPTLAELAVGQFVSSGEGCGSVLIVDC